MTNNVLGWINEFLSWEAFAPLGRLSFNVYLIHYDIELLVWLTFTYSIVIDHMFVVSHWNIYLTMKTT